RCCQVRARQGWLDERAIAAARTLSVQCGLNLMSCYLKLGRFEECMNEGSEVLLGCDDSSNVVVKACYRRGQAYRGLRNV
uniref:Uncharacterized protein n=1 Tax=Triticum urartu TaxID=4572 RepID=A0A8R7QN71_TRIUA